ncbi:protein FAM131A-like isoform X1 [Acipenser ruthenus]|nr:protein FAM131A-like isoform X1 [Acipenser ruthenus]
METTLGTRSSTTPGLISAKLIQVNVEDTVKMLPKSRRALTIQEIAALARSSLHGISQVVKDHVTKPTAMAQGRVAHLIEWKGWCKPIDSPVALESDFNSYSDLSEGEQEARFAAGVAEQFAIAEAKLRAWSSVDGEDSNDDSYDEDFAPASEGPHSADAVGPYPNYLRDILHNHMCQQLSMRQSSCEHESDSSQTVSPETLCSSLCSLEDHPLLKDLGSPTDLATKLFGALHGGEEILAKLQRGGESAFRNLGHLICNDSSYSVSYTESCFSPEDEEDMPCKDYGSVCKEDSGYEVRRKVSDVASSGVVSLDDDEEEEENEDV